MPSLKRILNSINNAVFSSNNKSKAFYTAAFLPFILITYSYAAWPFDIAIPLYGFILLIIKEPKLFSQKPATNRQKPFGLLLMLASLFLYFVLVPFFPDATFYGVANYSVYIIGLFLLFFSFHALREAFTPLFLIIGTTSVALASALVEPILTPYIPNLVSLIVAIVRFLGIKADVNYWYYPVITIQTPRGSVALGFIWGCVGFASTLLFSIILVVVLFEESGSLKTKALWSISGLLAMFFLNIFRAVMILVTDYFFGYEAGAQVHYFVGYAIFVIWVSLFLFLFSWRQAKRQKSEQTKEISTSPTAQQ